MIRRWDRSFGWTAGATLITTALQGPDLPGAACAGPDARLWDDELDRTTSTPDHTRATRHQEAAAICRGRCPARVECLAARLADPTLGPGVFGGRVFDPIGTVGEKDRAKRRANGTPEPHAQCQHEGCGNALSELQRQRRAHYCSKDCDLAAERDRKRALRAAQRRAA